MDNTFCVNSNVSRIFDLCCCSVRKKVPGCFRALSFRVGVSATMYRYSNLIKLTLELDRNLTFAMALAKITNSYYLCTLIYSTLRHSIILKKSNITIQLPPVFYSSESEISWKKNEITKLTCSGILRLDHVYKTVEQQNCQNVHEILHLLDFLIITSVSLICVAP